LAVVNVQDRRLDLSSVKTIQATEAEISRYQLKCGDLLLTEGGDPDKLGRGSLWNEEVSECIHQNHIFRVRITDSLITPLFLNWLIGSKRGKRYFLKSAKQTTGIASINLRQLRAFPILIPPIDLQLRFASAIEESSGLTTEMQQSRSALDHLFASLQYRAFQGEI
jgi:type I restriction enzyme S subunit